MARKLMIVVLMLAFGAITVLAGDAAINISDSSKQPLKIVRMVKPVYPAEAKAAGIEGTVCLKVTVATDGTVSNIVVKEGDPKLTEASVEAVRQWVYEPVVVDGKAVEVHTDVNVNFTLSEKK